MPWCLGAGAQATGAQAAAALLWCSRPASLMPWCLGAGAQAAAAGAQTTATGAAQGVAQAF